MWHDVFNTKVNIWCLALVALVAGLVLPSLTQWHGIHRGWFIYAGQTYLVMPENHLPTQTRIQELLAASGYPIKVDGHIGEDSRRAWDSEIGYRECLRLQQKERK